MEALVVAATPNRQRALSDVLYHESIGCVVCSTAAEARRVSFCRPFDVFIIYSGLIDEHGHELAIDLAATHDLSGIYIDDITRTERLESELNDCGIVVLTRPVTKPDLLEAVHIISVANSRVRTLKLKNEQLQSRLDDIKIIYRAKIALMRALGYTEEQAHKHIQRRAMETRMSERKVASEILKLYEA